MSEDILHPVRTTNNDMQIEFSPEMYNEALILIEDICLTTVNKPLITLGMYAPNRAAKDLYNRDLHREREFDGNNLRALLQDNLPKNLPKQRTVYDTTMEAIQNDRGGLYFFGTGKTFLISLVLAQV